MYYDAYMPPMSLLTSKKCLALTLLGLATLSAVVFLHNATVLLTPQPTFSLISRHPTLTASKLSMDHEIIGRSNFVQDSICSGCRHALVFDASNGGVAVSRCGTLILQSMKQSTMTTLQQAVQKVVREHPMDCKSCRECSPRQKHYWKYDRILTQSSIQSARTMMLSSVPPEFRIPSTAINNVTAYFADEQHAYPKREYLFDYNPSIVLLPDDQMVSPNAVYLASFRVSNQHFCLHPTDRKLMMRGHKVPAKNWLGLALLDKHLSIINEAVLDVSKSGFAGNVEDYRLFVLNGQLYLATTDMISPIWLHNAPTDSQSIPLVFDQSKRDNLPVFIRSFASCAPCSKKRGLCGKNHNYFYNSASGSIVTEIWPSTPHTTRMVDIGKPCHRVEEQKQFVDESSAVPSYATVEELSFPHLGVHEVLLTRGRGGACCIGIEHPVTNDPMLLGIMHSKTPSQRTSRMPSGNITDNHYFSQFYAFKPSAPYQVVALSGLFCLGFPSTKEQAEVPLTTVTTWRKLILGQKFICPRIHFVSGITRAADDSDSVIVAYGVNDCVARMIRVSIKDIYRILFRL